MHENAIIHNDTSNHDDQDYPVNHDDSAKHASSLLIPTEIINMIHRKHYDEKKYKMQQESSEFVFSLFDLKIALSCLLFIIRKVRKPETSSSIK